RQASKPPFRASGDGESRSGLAWPYLHPATAICTPNSSSGCAQVVFTFSAKRHVAARRSARANRSPRSRSVHAAAAQSSRPACAGRSTPEHFKRLEYPAQGRLAQLAQPVLQYARVDPPEVARRLEISVLQ